MSHELTSATSAFSVKQTMWHRLGHVLEEAPSFDDGLKLAEVDFEVEKRQAYVPGPAGFVAADGHFLVTRTDNNVVLGAVSDQYHVLQNRDAFAPLIPLLDEGLATLETGGSLRGGADTWMMIRYSQDEINRRTNGETERLFSEVLPFGLITTNHAGRAGVVVQDTGIRVVCANTLGFALSEKNSRIKIVHTESVHDGVKWAAEQVFGRAADRFKTTAQIRDVLTTHELTAKQFTRLVLNPVVPVDHLRRKLAKGDATTGHTLAAIEKAEEKRDRIRQLWTTGAGHSGDYSAWEAFNGLVEALDHDKAFGSYDENGVEKTNRVASAIRGTIDRHKSTVLRGLLRDAADTNETAKELVAVV
jgi:phage/plasmid-like protein (TIGR03299 family)